MEENLIPTDENTRVLLKNYTRKNGRMYDIFLKKENNNITAKTLEQLILDPDAKLKHEVYTRATIFPWVRMNNCRETQWQDWIASSFYLNYFEENGLIKTRKLQKNTISLNEYIDVASKKIEQNIKKVFDEHNYFILSYSRGIDSILLLSYIIKYGLLKKTKIIYVENNFGFSSDNILNFDFERELGIDVEKIEMNLKKILPYVNQTNPFKLHHYQSFYLQDMFPNDPIFLGYEGNSALMHKTAWIRRRGIPITDKNVYVTTALDMDWNEKHDPDHDFITYIEPYSRPWNNNENFKNFYMPISDVELLEMLPFINIDNVDPYFFADAQMAKKMIKDNVGNLLDKLIITENNNWINFWQMGKINIDDVDPSHLKLHASRKSFIPGVIYFKKEIEHSKKTKLIDINVLLGIKLHNYLLQR